MRPDHPLAQHFTVLFGPRFGPRLAKAGWGALKAASVNGQGELVEGMPRHMTRRLAAIVALAEAYWPEQAFEPTLVLTTADAVRHFDGRTHNLADRAVWLLALDENCGILQEVLIQFGGGPTAPPLVRKLLGQALRHGAASFYIVDHRPVEALIVSAATVEVFERLRDLCDQAGIVVHDYLLMGISGYLSVKQGLGSSSAPRLVA